MEESVSSGRVQRSCTPLKSISASGRSPYCRQHAHQSYVNRQDCFLSGRGQLASLSLGVTLSSQQQSPRVKTMTSFIFKKRHEQANAANVQMTEVGCLKLRGGCIAAANV